jgi:hypothetical protein
MERLRESLTTDLIRLHSLQSKINHTVLVELEGSAEAHDESINGLDDEVGEAPPDPGVLPPERRLLHLPSSHTTTTNQPFRQAELTLRIKQATRYLTALRDAIAQKSFQYSHVMQAAPSKGARTRTRSVILNISDRIEQYSRVYCRARAAMVRLGADERTLNKFKLLVKENVRSSSAILKPNDTGSTALRLSWIWETGPRISGSAPDTLRECKPFLQQILFLIDFSEVQRVHWIRARAQKNRWAEELLLVKYEMQWTTKSFLHKAREWQDKFDEPNTDPGPKAYAARQSAQWRYIALDADRLFRLVNSEYRSLII